MPRYNRAVIVGVGLLGGSLGLALRERKLAEHIVGVGRSRENLEKAVAAGAIDRFDLDLSSGCEGADLVVVCTPVSHVVEKVLAAASVVATDGLITDVGSTKAAIATQLQGCQLFCGSHPLAGSDRSGVEFAKSDLFQDRTTVVTPIASTEEFLVQATWDLWESVGSNVVQMSPAEHDSAVAVTSHLPHIVAAALAAGTADSLLPLVASGWKDTTRVAAGNVEMWLQIIDENRKPILDALSNFENSFGEWSRAIRDGDRTKLESLLTIGKRTRDSVGN